VTERKMRILIVDDANLMRVYYRRILENAGFDVDEALNGLEALEKVLTDPADMLIVDINMPQMDGISFIEALRRQALPSSSVPILVTSTEAGAKDFEAVRIAGGNYYLVKPVSADVLTRCAKIFCGLPA
jgi:two-component system, chemotaxis family, chemotaxis protein CheY